MQALVFSSRNYFQKALTKTRSGHDLHFLETRLESATAPLAANYPAVIVFVNDRVDRATLQILARGKTRLVATLSTGTNHIDVPALRQSLASPAGLFFNFIFILKPVFPPSFHPVILQNHADRHPLPP